MVSPPSGPLAGGRLVLASMGLFLTPILLAIVLAASERDGGLEGQFVSGLLGLMAGIYGAVIIARVLRARHPAAWACDERPADPFRAEEEKS
jgi:hypothetical protein